MPSVAVILACLVIAVPSSLLAQQRRCGETRTPKQLPAPSALVDSARAMADLSEAGIPPNGMVFSLLFREADSFPTIRPLDPSHEQSAVLLSRAVLPQQSKTMWAIRVRVAGGPAPTLMLERSSYCPPVVVATAPGTSRVVVSMRAGDQLPAANRRLRFVVEVQVTEGGAVQSTKMVQRSGIQDFDEELQREWQARRFLPALLDGFPIQSWYRSDGQTQRL